MERLLKTLGKNYKSGKEGQEIRKQMEVFLGSRSCQQSGEDLELQKSGGTM